MNESNRKSQFPEKFWRREEIEVLERELLANLKAQHPALVALLDEISDRPYEDTVYRFYHQSMKVYEKAPYYTRKMVELLRNLAPAGTLLSPSFEEIIEAGIVEKTFQLEHNHAWSRHSRPFIEAFFHARYFLEMAVKYGAQLSEAPSFMPSGWAALLCLYGIR